MKKRLLFIDDEASVLQQLQRAFRSYQEEWEMEYAPTADLARQILATKTVDVVLCDLQMTPIDGPALLAEIMDNYPRTIRFALSNDTDQKLALRCLGTAHQFLAKPCQPDTVKTALQRLPVIQSAALNSRTRQVICRLTHLPTIPSLYLDMVNRLNRADTSLNEIGELIQRDPVVTAKILKMANSAFLGLAQNVTSVDEAVRYLGLETVKTLVLALQVFTQFEQSPQVAQEVQVIWNHSMQTATTSKKIAQLEKVPQKLADEAFTVALLHDIGKLVLAQNFPEEYRLLTEEQDFSVRLEKETAIFGSDHAAIGGYLLALWGLPSSVVEAVAFHHAPEKCSSTHFTSLTAIHVANGLTNNVPIDSNYLDELHLSDRLDVWREAHCATAA